MKCLILFFFGKIRKISSICRLLKMPRVVKVNLIISSPVPKVGVVGWCEGAVYLTSLGRPTDIGLQLGKACYPCSG